MKISNLTFFMCILISGIFVGVQVHARNPFKLSMDTSLIFSDPVFSSDSIAIEHAAETFFQKKILKNRRYYRKLEATNALLLKRLKQQENPLAPKTDKDSIKYLEHYTNVKTAMGLLQDAAYLGLMKSYRINSKLQGTFLVGYNFLNDKTKINSPWIIRLGWKL